MVPGGCNSGTFAKVHVINRRCAQLGKHRVVLVVYPAACGDFAYTLIIDREIMVRQNTVGAEHLIGRCQTALFDQLKDGNRRNRFANTRDTK